MRRPVRHARICMAIDCKRKFGLPEFPPDGAAQARHTQKKSAEIGATNVGG